ncbi:MAG: N-acetylmuramoyl-L-alanine amidase [Solirubrobacterales bacterium]
MTGARLTAERHPAPNFEPGRDGERPRAIVLHTTDGKWEGTLAWFANPESGVSAHYLVGLDGRLVRLVDEADTARHAGRVLRPTATLAQGMADLNSVTIGIELCDEGDPGGVARPHAQYLAAARLVADIAARWEIPLDRDHVIGHNEVFAEKTCPGNLDVERVVREARAFSR